MGFVVSTVTFVCCFNLEIRDFDNIAHGLDVTVTKFNICRLQNNREVCLCVEGADLGFAMRHSNALGGGLEGTTQQSVITTTTSQRFGLHETGHHMTLQNIPQNLNVCRSDLVDSGFSQISI